MLLLKLLMGMSLMFSDRFCAVTTISSTPPPAAPVSLASAAA
jgi:hypothetical protein